MMNGKIIKATADDSPTISNILAKTWRIAYKGIVPQSYLNSLPDDYWSDPFRNWINNNLLTAWLICENAVPVGCIAYGHSREEKFSNWCEIVSIYVLPGYWRKGYGRSLLEKALSDLTQKGYRHCYLWVLKENYRARKFYEKHGFRCNQDEYYMEIHNKVVTGVRYVTAL